VAITASGGGDEKGAIPPALPDLPLLLLGALIGGLLLNIMPCDFPILGLKALSLARAGGSESEAKSEAVAYSLGVIVSCLALGGLMLALRAGGQEIGWAFQLQEPIFVLFLLLLMVGVTANLAGLFDLGTFQIGDALARRSGIAGAFWTGVLAALVATPCTGPFMAAAIGAALLLPVIPALALFVALGLGIALPFLAIAFFPPLRNRLPAPGPWLATFRKLMALPMGLTAIALLWLLSRLAGERGIWIGIIASCLVLGIILFQDRLAQKLRFSGILSAILAAGIFAFAASRMIGTGPDAASPAQAGKLGATPFSEKALAKLRSDGKPVFLYFTADWCISCKINERNAIDTATTKAAFDKAGVVVMRGDYTRPDPEIAHFLAQNGRSGVPLYIYYPKNGAGKILPQVLTPAIMTTVSFE
jgi:thiol:disulfide interchange protein